MISLIQGPLVHAGHDNLCGYSAFPGCLLLPTVRTRRDHHSAHFVVMINLFNTTGGSTPKPSSKRNVTNSRQQSSRHQNGPISISLHLPFMFLLLRQNSHITPRRRVTIPITSHRHYDMARQRQDQNNGSTLILGEARVLICT